LCMTRDHTCVRRPVRRWKDRELTETIGQFPAGVVDDCGCRHRITV
jgi:hypothetical protein